MQLQLVTKQMWTTLTAALAAWQAARQGELDTARTTVTAQGQGAVTAAQQADAQRQQMLAAAAIAGIPLVDTAGSLAADGTAIARDDMTVYTRAGGVTTPGLRLTPHGHLDGSARSIYALAQSAVLSLPRLQTKLRNGQPVKILGIGSSSMEGAGASNPATTSFLAVLRDYLAALYPESAITIVNKGQGGTSLPDMEARAASQYLPEQADLTIVVVGTNDGMNGSPTLSEFRPRYEGLISTLRAYGSDVLCIDSQYWPAQTAQVRRYNRAIQDAATQAGCAFFSRDRLMREIVARGEYRLDQMLIGDNFHGNDVAYRTWAEAVGEAIHAGTGTVREDSWRINFGHATVGTPAIGSIGGDGVQIANADVYPQRLGYGALTVPANTTRRLSLTFVGTGVRFAPVAGPGWPATSSLRYRMDGGAWTALPRPQATDRLRGGMWTLATNLPHDLHLVEVELIAGADAYTAFIQGWQVLCSRSAHGAPVEGLSAIYGPARVVDGLTPSLRGELSVGAASGQALVNGGLWRLPNAGSGTPAVAVPAGDASNPRVDALYWQFGLGLTLVSGTPAANPVAPVAAGVLLAHLRVAAGATTNAGLTLTDMRSPIRP